MSQVSLIPPQYITTTTPDSWSTNITLSLPQRPPVPQRTSVVPRISLGFPLGISFGRLPSCNNLRSHNRNNSRSGNRRYNRSLPPKRPTNTRFTLRLPSPLVLVFVFISSCLIFRWIRRLNRSILFLPLFIFVVVLATFSTFRAGVWPVTVPSTPAVRLSALLGC